MLIAPEESFKITKKSSGSNELGFDVDEVDLIPADGGRWRLDESSKGHGGRNFHSAISSTVDRRRGPGAPGPARCCRTHHYA